MNLQFTESTAAALERALEIAKEKNQTEIQIPHLILALLEDDQGYFKTLCRSLGLDEKPLLLSLEKSVDRLAKFEGEGKLPTLNPKVNTLLYDAYALCKEWKDSFISSDHLFLCFMEIKRRAFLFMEGIL